MSALVVSLLFSLGVSTWIYTKLQKYSGNNTQQSIVGTSIAAVVIFGLTLSILSLIL